MTSKNEWSQLKKVIVGIADEAKIPEIDLSMRTINYADKLNISNVPVGNYPEQVIEEANEDLEIFVSFLKSQNIDTMGYHYYMTPETALLGLEKLEKVKNQIPKEWSYADYPNLKNMKVFQ